MSFPFEEKDDARLQEVAVRNKPGFTSSPRRMSLFGITTVMFALGAIVLVLQTMFQIQVVNPDLDVTIAFYLVAETSSYLMVRLCDAFLSSASLNQRVLSVLYVMQSAPGAR